MMMWNSLPLLLLAISSVLAAPSAPYDGYTVVVPQKRAALVLDRLLIALQKALREGEDGEDSRGLRGFRGDGPRVAPLRITNLDDPSMMALSADPEPEVIVRPLEGPRTAPLRIAHIAEDTSSLQRRGQGGGGRGRVLRCYFNAITCF